MTMTDRFVTLTHGTALVVTDLHGDLDAFTRCVTLFHTLRERGEAQRLIFLGDLIHGYGPLDRDGSLQMLLRVIKLQEELGADAVIMLLGNHEMPHIYGITLAKGDMEFTSRFENLLGAHRERVMCFLKSLPFAIRTAAGVLLTHAGPALEAVRHVDTLRGFDHQTLLDETDASLAQAPDLALLYRQYSGIHGAPYDELARHYLAVEGPDDPRYPHLLRGFIISQQSREFAMLWDMLFTQNEFGLTPTAYLAGCQQFLSAFSAGAPTPQTVVVSGHIVTPRGFALVNRYHLRVSSAAHARPREAGMALLLDCAAPVKSADELLPNLLSVFEDR